MALAVAKRFELQTGPTPDRRHPTTQRFSPVPGGSGDGQALPRSVERIDEARRAAEAQSAVCDAIRAEIMEVFSQLDDEVDFMILFRRYILLEDWRTSRSTSAVPAARCSSATARP